MSVMKSDGGVAAPVSLRGVLCKLSSTVPARGVSEALAVFSPEPLSSHASQVNDCITPLLSKAQEMSARVVPRASPSISEAARRIVDEELSRCLQFTQRWTQVTFLGWVSCRRTRDVKLAFRAMCRRYAMRYVGPVSQSHRFSDH